MRSKSMIYVSLLVMNVVCKLVLVVGPLKLLGLGVAYFPLQAYQVKTLMLLFN